MTNIIAILLLLGEFQVAVEGPSGYHTGTYQDNREGVEQFFRDTHRHLRGQSGRFYPCVVYLRPIGELMNSALLDTVGPGTGYATSLINKEMVDKVQKGEAAGDIDAKVAEKVCVANFPADYRNRYPASAGVLQIQWGKPVPW